MNLIIRTYKLQLKHPFTISRGTRTEIPSLIVELQENGISGFGEATENPFYHTTVKEFEKELIQKALEKHRGKRKYAAAELGISERTLYRKIKEYNLME